MNGLRTTLLVIFLALGLISIGATSVFGMTAASAVATVNAEYVDKDVSCLLHCFVAQDIGVDAGALTVDALFFGAIAVVVVMYFLTFPSSAPYARAVPFRRDGPRLLLTICKRE